MSDELSPPATTTATPANADPTIEAQIAAAMANDQRGGRIEIGRMDRIVRRPISVEQQLGLMLRGQTTGDTRLVVQWDSDVPAADRVLFTLDDCDGTDLAHFSVIVKSPTLAVTRQRWRKPRDPRRWMRTPTNNRFERIRIEGGGMLSIGHYLQNSGSDQNNEHATWELCTVDGLAPEGSAWKIEGFNSMAHMLSRCGWQGGRYGVETTQGNFTARDCWGGSTSGADFHLGQPTGTITIDGGDFEHSRCLLSTAGQAGTSFPIRIVGTSARACTDPDGCVVRSLVPGPLTIDGCYLDSERGPRARILAWTFGEVAVTVRNTKFANRRSGVIADLAGEFPVAVDRTNKPFRIRMEHNHFNTADDRWIFVPEWEGEFTKERWPGPSR